MCIFGASVWTLRQSVLQDELVNLAAATSQLLQDDAERAPIPIFCPAFGCVARFHELTGAQSTAAVWRFCCKRVGDRRILQEHVSCLPFACVRVCWPALQSKINDIVTKKHEGVAAASFLQKSTASVNLLAKAGRFKTSHVQHLMTNAKSGRPDSKWCQGKNLTLPLASWSR